MSGRKFCGQTDKHIGSLLADGVISYADVDDIPSQRGIDYNEETY